MVLEPWLPDVIDHAAQEALLLPELERDRYFLGKVSQVQRNALHAGRSLRETQAVGSTFLDGARLLVRQLESGGREHIQGRLH